VVAREELAKKGLASENLESPGGADLFANGPTTVKLESQGGDEILVNGLAALLIVVVVSTSSSLLNVSMYISWTAASADII
jgi:hypothetical protein